MKHELIVEGVRVALPAKLKIEMVVENNLFDFSNIKSDSSVFFELPASDALNKVTKHAHRLQASAFLYMLNAVYIHNSHQYYEGKLAIRSFTNKRYKMMMITNGATIDIGDKRLRSIPWPQIDRSQFERPNELTYNQFAPENSGYSFPMCYGPKMYSSERIAVNPDSIFNRCEVDQSAYSSTAILVPFVYAKFILEYFLGKNGYLLQGNFTKLPIGKKLQHPTNYIIDGTASIKGEVDAGISETPFQTSYNFQQLVFNQEYIDNYNAHNNGSGEFVIPFAGNYTVSLVDLQIEQKRDPNPLFGSELYRIDVYMRVMGVDAQTSGPILGATSNGNSINNHYVSLGPYNFSAADADIGKTVSIAMSFQADNTRVSARIRQGRFKIVFSPMTDLLPTIPMEQWIPNQTFGDYLITLQQTHPLLVRLNPNEKALIIDFAPEIARLKKQPRDWTKFAGKSFEAQTNQDGYSLNYNYSQSDIDKLVKRDELVYKGTTLNDETAELTTPQRADNYLYSELLNVIYKATAIDTFGTLKYLPYSENIYPMELGNAATKIVPETRPVKMKYYPELTIPELPFTGNSELFKEGTSEFDLQISIYHGPQVGKDLGNGLTGTYPYSSPSHLNHSGNPVFGFSLHYQDLINGLYVYYYREFLTALLTALTVETNLLLPQREIRELDLARSVVIDHVEYTIKQLAYSLGEDSISESTASLVKLDPLARVIAKPPTVPREFSCNTVILEDGTPTDGEVDFNDVLTVQYTLSNLTEDQTISGIATINVYYIDGAGFEQRIDMRTMATTLQPMEVQTYNQSFHLTEENYPVLVDKYDGRIRISTSFGNRCASSRTLDYNRQPPQIDGGFNYKGADYSPDGPNGATYVHSWTGGYERSDGRPFTQWGLNIHLKINGNVICTWAFNQDKQNYNDPVSVNAASGYNYDTQIKPYVNIITDNLQFLTVNFRKIDYALINNLTNNGTTDNTVIYNFEAQVIAINQTYGYFGGNAPKDLFEKENIIGDLQISQDNTVRIYAFGGIKGYPGVNGSGLTNTQVCHEGLQFGTYNKTFPFVCQTGFGEQIYVHNPTNPLIGAYPDYLIKHKVNGAAGLVNIQVVAVQETAAGQIKFTNQRVLTDFAFDIQELNYRAAFSVINSPTRYLLTSATFQLTRNSVVSDVNLNVGGYFTVNGGTVIASGNLTVEPTRDSAYVSVAMPALLPGKYTLEATFNTDQVQTKSLNEIILIQT